ncbi:unnamed protein product [Alopecurus aequalis]
MPEFRYATLFNLSCIPDLGYASAPPTRPLLASPAAYLALLHLVAPVAFVILWWLWRDLPLERVAAHPPAVPKEQPPRNRAVLDPDRVGAAAAAVRGLLEEEILRPVLHANAHGYFRHQSIHFLEALPGDARLVDPRPMEQMIRGSPPAVEMLRQASIRCDPIGRLSDAAGNPSIFHADPCVLATKSIEMLISLKVVTVLVCLVWRELNGQYQQISQELKEECFTLIAGKSVEKVLEIEDALKGILDGTTDGNINSEESAIHPVNVVLMQVLNFFHHNRDMVQSLMAAGNPCCDILNSWESKIKKDTEKIPQYESGKMYIILLNNAYDVWQMICHGAAFSDVGLVSMLICMIHGYRKSYFDECWVPLIMPLSEEDYLKRPRHAYLDEFTQGFLSICHCQMTWKVLPALKYELRAEITDVVVTPYKAFLHALQANPSQLSEAVYSFKRFVRGKKNQNAYTAERLEYEIKQIFES